MEASAFPPSNRELDQHTREIAYTSQIWCNSNLKITTLIDLNNYGWKLIDEDDFYWFKSEEWPTKIKDVVNGAENVIGELDEERDDKNDMDINSFLLHLEIFEMIYNWYLILLF